MQTTHATKPHFFHSHWWIIAVLAIACLLYTLFASQQTASHPPQVTTPEKQEAS